MDDVISRQMAIDVVEESRRLNHHQECAFIDKFIEDMRKAKI